MLLFQLHALFRSQGFHSGYQASLDREDGGGDELAILPSNGTRAASPLVHHACGLEGDIRQLMMLHPGIEATTQVAQHIRLAEELQRSGFRVVVHVLPQMR